MYLSRVQIENIRCFEELDIELKFDQTPLLWNMILGDNSTGKTCLLRCIAIGLCDEASASALIKELEGSFIRKGKRNGSIIITLFDPDENIEFEIKTLFLKEHGEEIIEKEYDRSLYLQHKANIFICGYGVQRAGDADLGFRKYSILEAVYSLFNYQAKLQNPELILHRQKVDIRQAFLKKLEKVLALDLLRKENVVNKKYSLKLTRKGVTVEGPWGSMFLDEMSDGYLSTFTWLVDFIGWQTYANAKWLIDLEHLQGIVLLDELELHLHPSWQKIIVGRLKEEFPKIQFITTTHSPIVAAGAADLNDAKIVVLKLNDKKVIQDKCIPPLHGMRFGEILTSQAFGLYSEKSSGSEEIVTRYTELMSKQRDLQEEEEYQKLRIEIDEELPPGDTVLNRIVKKAIREALPDILKTVMTNVSDDALDIEIRKQMKDLFEK